MLKLKKIYNLNSKGTIFIVYIVITVIMLIVFFTSGFWFPDLSTIKSEDYGNTFEASDYYIKVNNAHYDNENKLLSFEYYIKEKSVQVDSVTDYSANTDEFQMFESYNGTVDIKSIEKEQTENVESEIEEPENEVVQIPVSSFPVISYIVDENYNKLEFTSQKDEKEVYKYYCSAELEKECDVITIFFSTTRPQYSELDTVDEFGNTIKGEVHTEETLEFYSRIDFRDVTIGKNNSVVPKTTTVTATTISQTDNGSEAMTSMQNSEVTTTAPQTTATSNSASK